MAENTRDLLEFSEQFNYRAEKLIIIAEGILEAHSLIRQEYECMNKICDILERRLERKRIQRFKNAQNIWKRREERFKNLLL